MGQNELSKELLKKLYYHYLQIRLSEEKLVDIYYAGKVPGHIHSGLGEEALQAVIASCMEEGDYYSGHHRPVSAGLALGIPYRDFYCEIMGKRPGTARGLSGCNHIVGMKYGSIGNSSSLGCDAAVPVGAALSCKRAGKGIAISENGDATSSRGPVHEAMVLAASWKLPVLFITQNNYFGISADSRKLLPTENPGVDRAPGYGMPFETADGTDILDVYDKFKKLVDYVRETGKPAALETKAYRWRGHFEGDLTKYRDKEEEKERQKVDGLARFKQYLLDEGVMTEEDQQAIDDEIKQAIDDAVEFAEAAQAPDLEDITELLHAPEEV